MNERKVGEEDVFIHNLSLALSSPWCVLYAVCFCETAHAHRSLNF